MNKIDLKKLTSIDDDFALWAAEQVVLLSAGKFDRVDVENVTGELEYLGNSQRQEIESRMSILLAHLLKWEYQPEGRTNSWRATLLEQRLNIAKVVRRSPSLKNHPKASTREEYEIARLYAAGETGLSESVFPANCPYSIEQILDRTFFPGVADKVPSKRRNR
jgi:hypothetical protein